MNPERLVTIIQARVGSSRLPGKVLLPLGGRTVFERMLERIRAARRCGTIVVATTTLPLDDPIVKLCRDLRVLSYRGDPLDLLDRHVQAARAIGAQHVVKIPSDCPLIDPEVIDRVIGHYLEHADRLDYVSNLHPASYPDGNDVEVVSLAALEVAHRDAARPEEREHTTPFLWQQPERFRVGNVAWPAGRDCSLSHRYVLDYPEDYAVIRGIYEALQPVDPEFGLEAIVDFLDRSPGLAALNARYRGTTWQTRHEGQLLAIAPPDDRSRPEVACHP